jgi:hypothetical protein
VSGPPRRIEIVSPAIPALVAARRDEGGPWIRLNPVDGSYVLPDLGARFTIVAVCVHDIGSRVDVHHWTREDNPDLVISCFGEHGEERVELKPRFAPVDVEQSVSTGGSSESCKSTRRECELRRGMRDMIISYGTSFDSMRARILRGFQAVEGASFDADASTGWRPDRRKIELESSWRGFNNGVYVCLQTRSGAKLLCSGKTFWNEFPGRVDQEYIRVPNPARVPTDCDLLEFSGFRMCLPDVPHPHVVIESRSPSAMRYDRATHVLSFSLGDADALGVEARGRGRSAKWTIMASKHWLGGATRYAFIDVTAIPGWNAEWSLPARETIDAYLIWGSNPAPQANFLVLRQSMRAGDRVQWAGGFVENADSP